MLLNLQFAPTPENAPRHAAVAVNAAQEVSGYDLDYSPNSLQAVDAIMDELREDGVSENDVAETLFSFGCYVGEVFVRHAGGTWRNTEQTSLRGLTDFPIVVELHSTTVCNPIGKVFKRLTNGPEDSLAYFYEAFTKQQ